MDQNYLKELFEAVRQGQCSTEQAIDKLRHFPAQNLDEACIDHQRSLRTGMPEVIFGASKSTDQIITIVKAQLHTSNPVLVTKVEQEKGLAIQKEIPELTYHRVAKMLTSGIKSYRDERSDNTIVIICAGTSDLPIAEEAAITAEYLGHPIIRIYDVGIAGIHRLFAHWQTLDEASVIIAVAGMEGALPSVVAGLVQCPVIGVPTSIGYGTSFGGVTALLGMLNSCAPGLAVVNIDNGFGAACIANAINLGKKSSSTANRDI
jgi:hypothetical protein